MLVLIKALLKPHMQFYYIVIEKISKLRFCIGCHIRCYIILYIIVTRLKLKSHLELQN